MAAYKTNGCLYGDLPKVNKTIKKRPLQVSGHCVCHYELDASKFVLWKPLDKYAGRGKRCHSHVDNLTASIWAERQ